MRPSGPGSRARALAPHLPGARRERDREVEEPLHPAAGRHEALGGEERQDRHHRCAEAREVEEKQDRPM